MKNHIPPSIFKRPNMGLEMPHAIWFLREFRPLAERYFSPKAVERPGILSAGAVSQMWEEHLSRKKDHGRSLWCILNFLIWFDLFVYNNDYKNYLTPWTGTPPITFARSDLPWRRQQQ
jgi:asparagine synthase (glutamine-hydrolysing)